MGDQQQREWGLLLLIYIVPLSIWAMYRFARKRPAETAVWIWTAGLVCILALTAIKAPPEAGILTFALAMAFGVVRLIYRTRAVWLHKRSVRAGISFTGVWWLGLLGWYLTFGDSYSLRDEHYVGMAVFVPICAAALLAGIAWVGCRAVEVTPGRDQRA